TPFGSRLARVWTSTDAVTEPGPDRRSAPAADPARPPFGPRRTVQPLGSRSDRVAIAASTRVLSINIVLPRLGNKHDSGNTSKSSDATHPTATRCVWFQTLSGTRPTDAGTMAQSDGETSRP